MAALQENPSLTGVEKNFGTDEIIVTKTDLKGKITYANRTFYKLAEYREKEIIGSQHNIIRHPKMPRCVFKLLWDTLKSGKEIFAYVNNRSKNGDSYWVFAHVTPSFDGSGNAIGYHSNRRVPNKQVLSQHIIPLYKKLLAVEAANSSPKDGMEAAFGAIEDLLKESKVTFNQFMFSLGV